MLDKAKRKNDPGGPIVIKKYANRRLYNTESSTYVTLEDLAEMVRLDRDFVVYDAKSGDDLTHSVLTQIIVEQEARAGGENLLPIPFLRQLIRFYDDSFGRMVPSYLQCSLEALTKEQQRYREQFTSTWGGTGFDAYQEQARKNLRDVRTGHVDVVTVCSDRKWQRGTTAGGSRRRTGKAVRAERLGATCGGQSIGGCRRARQTG